MAFDRLSFRRILHGGKWQNFAAGIATGAAYICLSGLHWQPRWLIIIQAILFILNCTIFTVNCVLIAVSAYIKKDRFIANFTNPASVLFVPLVALDLATIFVGIYLYAHELGDFDAYDYPLAYIAVFWIYFAVSIVCCVPLIFIWFGSSSGKSHELSSFSLTGCFLVFPMMLVGTMAFNALERIGPEHPQTLAILLLGYIMQGLGFSVAMCFIVVSQYRAIRYGFHRGPSSATAFIAAGPPGYTALALIRLGEYGTRILPLHTALPVEAANVIYYAAIPAAFMLLGLAIYFWIFALIPWSIGWRAHLYLNPAGAWPLTFPTTGMVLTFAALGDVLQVPAFWILQAIFGGIVVFQFTAIFVCWLYRLVRPADPQRKAVRYQAYEQEHISFWTAFREAEEAEKRYVGEKGAKSGASTTSNLA